MLYKHTEKVLPKQNKIFLATVQVFTFTLDYNNQIKFYISSGFNAETVNRMQIELKAAEMKKE